MFPSLVVEDLEIIADNTIAGNFKKKLASSHLMNDVCQRASKELGRGEGTPVE